MTQFTLKFARKITIMVWGVQKLFFGMFTELGKATLSLDMSVRLHGTTQLPLDEFS